MRGLGRTRWDVVVVFNRDVLGELDIVDGLENRESLADSGNSHLLETVWIKKA